MANRDIELALRLTADSRLLGVGLKQGERGVTDFSRKGQQELRKLGRVGRDSKEMFALLATLDQGGLKGSMGGTSLSAFFRQAVKVDAFKDANGDLKSTVDILDTLRKRLDGMGTAKRAGFLQKVFGDEGGRAAQILLRQGAGSYEDMTAQMGKAVSLQEKLAERLKGYNAQLESLKGTAKSTFATMFEPALDPLTKLISKTNEWAGALGEAALENKKVGQIGTGVAAGVAGAGLLYGGYHLLKGLGSGGKMLGALKGGAGLAGGVAMGKALEEAAGVPSVFVVNMPKEFGGTVGTGGLLPGGKNPTKGAGKWLGRLGVPLMLASTGLELYSLANDDSLSSKEKTVGYSGAAGGLAGGLAGAAAGAALGSIVPVIGTAIGGLVGGSLGYFGGGSLGEVIAEALTSATPAPAEMKGQITIRLEGDQRAKVTKLESSGGPSMNVYTGVSGVGGATGGW